MASPTTTSSSAKYDDDDWVDAVDITNAAELLLHSGPHPQALDTVFLLFSPLNPLKRSSLGLKYFTMKKSALLMT